MSLKRKIPIAIVGAGLTLSGVAGASAGTWHSYHPRRAEVNHRLTDQDARIHRDVREGRVSSREAADLQHADNRIRMQERHDARFHGGHITRHEQTRLNHEENRVSGKIHRDAR